MSLPNIRLLFVVLLILCLSSCDGKISQKNYAKLHPYSILLEKYDDLNQAIKFISDAGEELKKIAHIEQIEGEGYQVLVGQYANSLDAGEFAFDLVIKGIIKKFRIVHDKHEVLDEFNNVLFISRCEGRPSVFNYNLISKRNNVIWSKRGHKVTSLTLSNNCNSLFFTTTTGFGKSRGIPYVHGAALFHLTREQNKSDELTYFGDGYQLYSYWATNDTFKVNFSFIDHFDPKIVNQKIFSFDSLGNQGKTKERKYNLLKDGFPSIPNRIPIYYSPNRNFNLRVLYDDQNESNYYIKDIREHSEVLIVSGRQRIRDACWSKEGNYLFILTYNSTIYSNKKRVELTGELWIIDAVHKKRLKVFAGYQFENLLVHGKFLFFDERLNNLAKICIYNYSEDKVFDTISFPGGCGLNNLPQ
jgi:hypothetical protein